MPDPNSQLLVEQALRGKREALEQLVEYLAPVIQVRLVRTLHRQRGVAPSRHEVNDLSQDVFAKLFAHQGRLLRDWDPMRGLSLRNFVGLVATRHAQAVLRSLRRNTATDEVNDPVLLDEYPGPAGDEHRLIERDRLSKLILTFKRILSPLGLELFDRLYVREQSTSQIEIECDLSPDAVHQWRSRLRKLARRTLQEGHEGVGVDEELIREAK